MDYEERPKRMMDLPQYTQDFLAYLREEEIDELHEAIKFMQSVKTVSHFFKWFIITGVAIFLAMVSLGEGLIKVKAWFK